jgi:hypothetical protein
MLTVIAAGGCKRYVLRVDEKLTAFLEIEAAIRAASDWC